MSVNSCSCWFPSKVFRLIRFSMCIKEWEHRSTQQNVTVQKDQRPGDRTPPPESVPATMYHESRSQ